MLALDISVPCTERVVYIVLRKRTQKIVETFISSFKGFLMKSLPKLRHIRERTDQLHIAGCKDAAAHGGIALDGGVFPVVMTAGVSITNILLDSIPNNGEVLIQLRLHIESIRFFLRPVSGEGAITVRAELRFIRIGSPLRFVVDGAHGIGAAFPAVFVHCGDDHIVFVPQVFHILLQTVCRDAAHGYASRIRDVPGSQIQIKQLRRMSCVIAVHLKEIAHLVQHHIIGVRFLYGVILVPACVSLSILPLKRIILRLFLRRQEAVFTDQFGDALGDIRPVHLHIRAILFFQDNAFSAVILAAVRRAGYRVRPAANAVFSFQKVLLLLGAVFFSEIGVDAPLSALNTASAGQ